MGAAREHHKTKERKGYRVSKKMTSGLTVLVTGKRIVKLNGERNGKTFQESHHLMRDTSLGP